MHRIRFALLASLAIGLSWAGAQVPPAPAPPPPPKDEKKQADDRKPDEKKPEAKKAELKKPEGSPEFDVAFLDAGNIKVIVLDVKLDVTTKYGKLSIPFTDVRRVELGFRYPDGIEVKLTAAIEKLGAPLFQDREDAEEELMKLKDFALPLLKIAAKRDDEELSRRAQDLVKRISKTTPADRQNAKDFDLVETADLTIRGRVELTALKVKSKQFGETTLQLAEVKNFRAMSSGAANGEISLDASKYAKLNWSAWLDTGIDVNADQPLEIVSSGQIDVWPQNPGKYMADAQGNGSQAPNAPAILMQPQPNPGGGFNPGFRGFVQAGSVIGRIGETGAPFIVGGSFRRTKAAANGRLYLQIAPSSRNNDDCSGSYKVKVKAGE